MDNKPLLWVLGGGAFAFTAVVAYWIFAITRTATTILTTWSSN
jgi:hypothetical protein